MIRPYVVALMFCLLSMNCVGTDVGNPQEGEVEIELEFAAFEETPAGALTLDNGVQIDQAWMVLTRVRLRQANPCEDAGDFDLREPIVADLLRPDVAFGERTFRRDAGDYCRLSIEFDEVDLDELPAGAPAELAEHSIFIRGRRADGTPFEIRADFGDRFRLDAEASPFRLEQARELLQVAFAANTWIDADALNAAQPSGGVIRIDDDNNDALLDAFRDAVRRSARLFREGSQIASGQAG